MDEEGGGRGGWERDVRVGGGEGDHGDGGGGAPGNPWQRGDEGGGGKHHEDGDHENFQFRLRVQPEQPGISEGDGDREGNFWEADGF